MAKQLLSDIKTNLSQLKGNGVVIAIGSDTYNDNSMGEIRFLRDLDVFSNEDLLRMCYTNSVQTIFPARRLVALEEGYEASFLVLNGNPLEDWKYISESELRINQGQLITITN